MEKGLILAPGLDNFITEFVVNSVKPKFTAFLVTEATFPFVNQVISENKISNYKLFFIKDIFSTSETIQEFLNAFQWVKSNNVKDIVIDATNVITVIEMGTYVSAALIELHKDVLEEDVNFKLVYVHTDYEIKDNGIAGEVRGTEKLVELDKPIDSLSFVLAFDAIRAFNKFRYSQAAETFSVLVNNTSGEKSILYSGLMHLSKGYEFWNKMQIPEAIDSLNKVNIFLDKVKSFGFVPSIISKVNSNLNALNKLKDENPERVIIDLYANALRQAKDGRIDDALARFYSCIERIIQYRLSLLGIDTKSPDYSKLPDSVSEKFKELNGSLSEELELKKAALLLSLTGDSFGAVINNIKYNTFIGLIGLRNSSILAHGTKPISQKHYSDFFDKLITPFYDKFTEDLDYAKEHEHLNIDKVHEVLYKKPKI